MAKYLYKNTHYSATMDPKRTIKMSSKVLSAGWGPTACHSITFAGLYISSSPRAFATGSHAEKPILRKMKQKRFNTRKHWDYTFIRSSWADICFSIGEKKRTQDERTHLCRNHLTPSTSCSWERSENAIFQNGQTHKNREVERGRSVELKSSTACPPMWIIY